MSPTSVAGAGRQESSLLRGSAVVNRTLLLSLSSVQPLPVTLRIRTVPGRTVLDARSDAPAAATGSTTLRFPLGTLEPGVYSLEVRAGLSVTGSILLMP